MADKIGDDINNEPDPLKAKIVKIINKCLFDLALNFLTNLFNNYFSAHFNFVLCVIFISIRRFFVRATTKFLSSIG